MKYIRGQDGGIYSVSRLKPPCRVTSEGEQIWRMSVFTVNGERHTYATFSTEEVAIQTYKLMVVFMDGNAKMIQFSLGANGLPSVVEDWLRVVADKVFEFVTPMFFVEEEAEDSTAGAPPDMDQETTDDVKPETGSARPWMSIPPSAVRPWWEQWWPWRVIASAWRRKGGNR